MSIPKTEGIVGSKFNMLTVQKESYSKKNKGKTRKYRRCLCECGNETWVETSKLTSFHTKSCGCLKTVKTLRDDNYAYRVWVKMRNRCNNKNNDGYSHYGGRGIKVCKRWDFVPEGFDNFISDMGQRPVNHTLDRIDVNGNYEPSNCRWATQAEQTRNTRKQLEEYVGVSWHSQRGMWRARISIEGKEKHLGLFSSKRAAREARKTAELEFWGVASNSRVDQ